MLFQVVKINPSIRICYASSASSSFASSSSATSTSSDAFFSMTVSFSSYIHLTLSILSSGILRLWNINLLSKIFYLKSLVSFSIFICPQLCYMYSNVM